MSGFCVQWVLNLNNTEHPQNFSEGRGFTRAQKKKICLLVANKLYFIICLGATKGGLSILSRHWCIMNILSILGLRQNPLKPGEEIPLTAMGFLLDSTSAIFRGRSGIMGKVSLTSREAELLLLQLMGKKNALFLSLLCEEKFWEWHLWSTIYLLWCFIWGTQENRKNRRNPERILKA